MTVVAQTTVLGRALEVQVPKEHLYRLGALLRRLFRALPSIARALQYRGAPTTVPWKESVESYGEARAKDYPREEWHHMDEEDELEFSSYLCRLL